MQTHAACRLASTSGDRDMQGLALPCALQPASSCMQLHVYAASPTACMHAVAVNAITAGTWLCVLRCTTSPAVTHREHAIKEGQEPPCDVACDCHREEDSTANPERMFRCAQQRQVMVLLNIALKIMLLLHPTAPLPA
jgi:hypothetical protein